MSLQSEKNATVITGKFVIPTDRVLSEVWNAPVAPLLGRNKVLVGTVSPRLLGLYSITDVNTGAPMQLPPGSVLRRMLFVPEVPLVSINLASLQFMIVMSATSDFNVQLYYPSFTDVKGTEVNNRVIMEVADTQSSPSSYDPFPYVGINQMNEEITKGTLKIYAYYA